MKSVICFMLIAMMIVSCKKAELLPPLSVDIELRPVSGVVHYSAQPFTVCSGEIVSYDGKVSYQYTVKNKVIHLLFTNLEFAGDISTWHYNLYTNKDTSFRIAQRKSYMIQGPINWVFESHTSMNFTSTIQLRLYVDSDMNVKVTAGTIVMTCTNPPYLF